MITQHNAWIFHERQLTTAHTLERQAHAIAGADRCTRRVHLPPASEDVLVVEAQIGGRLWRSYVPHLTRSETWEVYERHETADGERWRAAGEGLGDGLDRLRELVRDELIDWLTTITPGAHDTRTWPESVATDETIAQLTADHPGRWMIHLGYVEDGQRSVRAWGIETLATRTADVLDHHADAFAQLAEDETPR